MRDSRLNSRAFAAMTGGGARSFERTGESMLGLGLRRSARPRPARYDRTGRKATKRESKQPFGARHVSKCEMPASLDSPLTAPTNGVDTLEFDSGKLRWDDESFGRCTNASRKRQSDRALSALSETIRDGRLEIRQITRGICLLLIMVQGEW